VDRAGCNLPIDRLVSSSIQVKLFLPVLDVKFGNRVIVEANV